MRRAWRTSPSTSTCSRWGRRRSEPRGLPLRGAPGGLCRSRERLRGWPFGGCFSRAPLPSPGLICSAWKPREARGAASCAETPCQAKKCANPGSLYKNSPCGITSSSPQRWLTPSRTCSVPISPTGTLKSFHKRGSQLLLYGTKPI